MQHLCNKNLPQKHQEEKKLNQRKSLIIDPVAENPLKSKNFQRLMEMGGSDEEVDEKEMIQRSQTIIFLSKFLNDNEELSNIIIPSAKSKIN